MVCALVPGMTVLFLLWWPVCLPQPVCFAAPVEASLSIIFTRQAANPPTVSITSAGSIFDASGTTWRSRYPVAPPGTYVKVHQEGTEIGGAWADPEGFVDLLVPGSSTASCALSYFGKQSMDVVRGSIHRLSGRESEAQPAATRDDYFLHLAYEGPGGQGEMRSWNLQTGVEGGKYTWSSPAGPVLRPWAVPNKNSCTYYIFHDIKTSSGFLLAMRSTATRSFRIADVARPVPHSPVAYIIGTTMYAYYTWPLSRVTAVAEEACRAKDGSSMSTEGDLILGPPNLSNLTLASMPSGGVWLSGEENGRVFLYKRHLPVKSVAGERPALAYVAVSGQARILMAYLKRQGQDTLVQGELLDGTGAVRGATTTLFTIPQDSVERISLIQSPAGDCWLFWQGTYLGRIQIFVTRVALPW